MTPEEERLVVAKSETMSDEELKQLWKEAAAQHERECKWQEESNAKYILLNQMREEKRAQMTPEERQADIERERQERDRQLAR